MQLRKFKQDGKVIKREKNQKSIKNKIKQHLVFNKGGDKNKKLKRKKNRIKLHQQFNKSGDLKKLEETNNLKNLHDKNFKNLKNLKQKKTLQLLKFKQDGEVNKKENNLN